MPEEEGGLGDQKVCFIGEPPAYDEDVMAVMEYDEFYNCLGIYSENYLQTFGIIPIVDLKSHFPER
ncbi:hypothetical protein NST33_20840 [Paenibacillus sp. FSL L8-0435]|uniref:hypothetical protein n=1 Tax=Paenibacillus sp. FSL L8-0435 TaxID=2954618 RepID=UPI0030D832BD